MRNRCFIDTNLFVYIYSNDKHGKSEKAREYIRMFSQNNDAYISSQVINELSFWLFKNSYNQNDIIQILNELNNNAVILLINFNTTIKAIDLKERYKMSWWDSLLLATALENNCTIFYSEDMQQNQIIENKMKIINPLIIN